MGAELRQFPRRPLSATIKVTYEDQTVVNAVGADISIQGIGFVVRSLLRVGQSCTIDFDLIIYGKKEHIHAEVDVVHSAFIGLHGYRTGVKFSKITSECLQNVTTFMR